jgi:triacylglycerol lipase
MTISWLQRFITLGSLILWVSLAAWLWSSQRGWAWVCLVMPIAITPLLLGIQCIWAAFSNRRDPAPSAGFLQWLGAWWAECIAAARVFTWWQPFRHLAIADHFIPSPAHQQAQRGVVLVHGFFCNRALWTEWMKHLQAEKRVFIAVDLEPAFGTISDYAQVLEDAVKRVELATGLAPVIIGHSMGGLAIRAWAAKYVGKSGSMARVHRIITLGTPHHGTAIAIASHGENGSQMRLGSAWLADNASRLPDSFAKYCTCYFSHCDNIVFPASSATLIGADNRHIAGHAHVQLIFSTEIQQASFAYLET